MGKWAEEALAKDKNYYDIPLIAVYGYYKILASKEDKDGLAKGIELVDLTSPYFYNENLQLLLAKTHVAMNNREKAKIILNELIAKDLLTEEAEKLLEEI